MVMPNFLIIGAAKAGTTSLYYYLDQHPQIYMSSDKEPRFFAPEFYTNNGRKQQPEPPLSQEDYLKLFAGYNGEQAIGEASPEYIYYARSPQRIKEAIPEAKLIAILRDPAERAFSQYCYNVGCGWEDLTFEQALAAEAERMQQEWLPGYLYQQAGFYYEQLQRYFALFRPEQIRIYLYEELDQNSVAICQDIFAFLGVEPFTPDLTRKNTSKIPKNRLLNKFLLKNEALRKTVRNLVPKQILGGISRQIKKHAFESKPTIQPETRRQLVQLYRDDILQLSDLIHKDLSSWLIS